MINVADSSGLRLEKGESVNTDVFLIRNNNLTRDLFAGTYIGIRHFYRERCSLRNYRN